jgi:hypothetical protein
MIRERGMRWVNEQKGLDPDAPEVQAKDFAELAASAAAALEELAEDEGLDLREPLPTTLGERRLREASIAVATAVRDEDPPVKSLSARLVMKAWRLASHLRVEPLQPLPDAYEDTLWSSDGAPNLFLVDHMRQELRAMLEARRAEAGLEALRRLDHLIDPMLAAVAPRRGELDARIAAGTAPSPFCTCPEVG